MGMRRGIRQKVRAAAALGTVVVAVGALLVALSGTGGSVTDGGSADHAGDGTTPHGYVQPAWGYNVVDPSGAITYFGVPDPSAVTGIGGTGAFGGFYGSLPDLGIHVDDIVGMASTCDFSPSPSSQGYDLVGRDGGVFVFPTSSAAYFGSLPERGVHVDDIVGMAMTPDRGGYLLVGADGGVFAFGDAHYEGSLPGNGVHVDDVVGIAEQATGTGYWLAGADGNVYSFGTAPSLGSVVRSSSAIASIQPTPSGRGYWVAGISGAVWSFGDATPHGDLPGLGVVPAQPIVGMASPDGGGYWLVGTDGGVFNFGSTPFNGSVPERASVDDIVAVAPTVEYLMVP